MNFGNMRVLLLVTFTLALSACGAADTKTENNTVAPVAAVDNTAINQRDNSGITTTPIDQAESASDLAISAKIRQAIVDDKAFSLNAHNVKIVTNTGVVTLRGPVKSMEEKNAVESMAKQVAGVTRVDNLIEIEATK